MPDPDTRLDYGGLSRFWNKVKTYITGVLPGNATQSAAGLMSAADKTKMDQLAPGLFTTIGFSITPSQWTESSGVYSYTISDNAIGTNTTEDVYFDKSVNSAVASELYWERSGNTLVLHTNALPIANVVGTVRVLGNSSEHRIVEMTSATVPVTKGGTGAANEAGARSNLGLGNVENKSSATIRSEITKSNVDTALGTGSGTTKYYREDGTWTVPPDTTYSNATTADAGLMSASDKSKLDGIQAGAQVNPGAATQSAAGLMSAADKAKLDGVATGATANAGTITGITMNGASKGTSGVVDLGTVITSHQDISGKVSGPASATDAHIAVFDGTSGKLVKDSGYTIATSVPSNAVFTDTTYESKNPFKDGTDLSLVTTGEKYRFYNQFSNYSMSVVSSSTESVVSISVTGDIYLVSMGASDPSVFASDVTVTTSNGNTVISFTKRANVSATIYYCYMPVYS